MPQGIAATAKATANARELALPLLKPHLSRSKVKPCPHDTKLNWLDGLDHCIF